MHKKLQFIFEQEGGINKQINLAIGAGCSNGNNENLGTGRGRPRLAYL